jgi:hypothetical protein
VEKHLSIQDAAHKPESTYETHVPKGPVEIASSGREPVIELDSAKVLVELPSRSCYVI